MRNRYEKAGCLAGFFFLLAFQNQRMSLQAFDLSVQAALVAGGFILVKNAFVYHAVDHRYCLRERCLSCFFVAVLDS